MNDKRPTILLFAALAVLLAALSAGGCSNPKSASGIAHEEYLLEQGVTDVRERVYLRQKTEELARKTKGVESVKGIALSWDSPNKVTAMADVQMEAQPRVLSFVFMRFWPTETGQSDKTGSYWREMTPEAIGTAP